MFTKIGISTGIMSIILIAIAIILSCNTTQPLPNDPPIDQCLTEKAEIKILEDQLIKINAESSDWKVKYYNCNKTIRRYEDIHAHNYLVSRKVIQEMYELSELAVSDATQKVNYCHQQCNKYSYDTLVWPKSCYRELVALKEWETRSQVCYEIISGQIISWQEPSED